MPLLLLLLPLVGVEVALLLLLLALLWTLLEKLLRINNFSVEGVAFNDPDGNDHWDEITAVVTVTVRLSAL